MALDVVRGHLVDADGLDPGVVAGGEVQQVRSRTDGRRTRVRRREHGADHVTVLQVTVLPAGRGTTLTVHQEHLTGRQERERSPASWSDRVESFLANPLG